MNNAKNIPMLTNEAVNEITDAIPKVVEALPQNVAIVYNAYSVDAVITAAFLQTFFREKNVANRVASYQSNQVSLALLKEHDRIYWVGVVPTKAVASSEDIVLEMPTQNASSPVPACLLYEAVILTGKEKQDYWRASLLVEAFNKMDKGIPMDVQVWLFTNFQEALSSLAVNRSFSFVAPDTDGFWRQLAHLKNQMRKMTKVVTVEIEGKRIQVPLINCQPWLAPWVSRLASLLWDTILIADHTWEGVVWCGVSRQNHNTEAIINKLSESKAGKVILANVYRV